jgi:hypothetical protein
MLVTTQAVAVLREPNAAIAMLMGLPSEGYEGRVIGPAGNYSEYVDEYVVAVRSEDNGPFDFYIRVADLGMVQEDQDGNRINVVGFVTESSFEDAIIEAFIPDALEDDFF